MGNAPKLAKRAYTESTAGKVVLRLIASALIGTGIVRTVWQMVPNHLVGKTDIMGYPIFANFNINRDLSAFEIWELFLPVSIVVIYFLLGRFGPLRSSKEHSAVWPPKFLGKCSETDFDIQETLDGRKSAKRIVIGGYVGRIPKSVDLVQAIGWCIVPGVTISIESAIIWPALAKLSWFVASSSGAYVILCAAGGWYLNRRNNVGNSNLDEAKPNNSFVKCIGKFNSYVALASIGLLYGVSRSTGVFVGATPHFVRYSWLPLPLLAIVIVGFLVFIILNNRRDDAANESELAKPSADKWIVVFGVVPVLIFILTASLAPAISQFLGFDDTQAMVGAQLVFYHHLLPWRNLYFIHGVLSDSLGGAIGMPIFGDTAWGSNSGLSFFMTPISWIVLYLFMVRFAVRKFALVMVGIFCIVLGLFPAYAGTRFMFVPLILVTMDVMLATRRRLWCALFMLSIVINIVIVPEVLLVAIGPLVAVIGSECVHRSKGASFLEAFHVSIWCTLWGLIWAALTAAYLLATSSMSGFVDYFATTVSGHQLMGGIPRQWTFSRGYQLTVLEFVIPIVLVVGLFFWMVVRINRRSAWSSRQWVLAGSWLVIPLYSIKAIDRFDVGHVSETFAVCIPGIFLGGVELLSWANGTFVRMWLSWKRKSHHIRRVLTSSPITFLVLILVLVSSPFELPTVNGILTAFREPLGVVQTPLKRLGYSNPNNIDIHQIEDLRRVYDFYSGANGAIFNFDNDIGVPFMLLDRAASTYYYYVAVAQPRNAQEIEISDLRRSQPNVVVFSDTSFGLPIYDGIPSMEDDYLISEYLLRHYTPVFDTHGALIMLRNDLIRKDVGIAPLSQPPVFSGLYEDAGSCDWGYALNYLTAPSADSLKKSVHLSPAGGVQNLSPMRLSGWSFSGNAAGMNRDSSVVLVSRGLVIGTFALDRNRTDVAKVLHNSNAMQSGFEGQVELPTGRAFSVYVETHDGSLQALASYQAGYGKIVRGVGVDSDPGLSVGSRVLLGDGGRHLVIGGFAQGSLDSVVNLGPVKAQRFIIPSGVNLDQWGVVAVNGRGALREGTYSISNMSDADAVNSIVFRTLSSSGGRVYVRSGSCLQWYGFQHEALNVAGEVITGGTVSGAMTDSLYLESSANIDGVSLTLFG